MAFGDRATCPTRVSILHVLEMGISANGPHRVSGREGALRDPKKAGGEGVIGDEDIGGFGFPDKAEKGLSARRACAPFSARRGSWEGRGRPKSGTGSAKTISRDFVLVERRAETGEKTNGEKSRKKRELG